MLPSCLGSTKASSLNFTIPQLLMGLVNALWINNEVASEQPSLFNLRELCEQVVWNRPIINIKVLLYPFFTHTLG
uniref:Uncharacterized protein n=1 Tax=Arundo donax TaxID=35708 RepID=A0A0A9E3I0_ARUDO